MDWWIQVFELILLATIIKGHPQNYQKYTVNRNRYPRVDSSSISPTTESEFRVVFPENNEDTYPGKLPPISVKRNSEGKLEASIEMGAQKNHNKMGANGSMHIVFPQDDIFATFTEPPINNQPHCNKRGSFFCEKVDNYPIDQVIRVIQQESNKLEAAFGEDFLPEPLEISQRIDPGEESLCHSVERLIFPQAGLSKDNTWSFIINHENYTQGVRIEECVNPGQPCSMTESFPNGYRTECKQKYIYRQMLGYSPTGKVVKELFRLPSCCKCILKAI